MDYPYHYDPHGFIVAATTPLQPRAGAVPLPSATGMQRAPLANSAAYQALMAALAPPPAFTPTPTGAAPLYTPPGIPQATRINYTPLPGQPGTVQPMAAPVVPAGGLLGVSTIATE